MCAVFEPERKVRWPGTDIRVVEVFEKLCEAHGLIGEVAIGVGIGGVEVHGGKLEYVCCGVELNLWEGADGQFAAASVTVNRSTAPASAAII
jgi:hypothetical protein